ncbi:GNAT family N-acetyltransferase [Paenibacillus sp. IHBB 10380]|uniref:GNAT family N-acetyltransferase n=1 Tax=Paenibacillus sp. IHBB 10380 TaxID=1566358 RepID=UPI0005CFC4A6|nr:GNAT family N-acetyltransferase [Paenibacillus sp. IHBB 10380]AJS59298.1 2-aminoglycoside phosphotransferase [Paenibacillus sp. IHBB 10380]
MTLFQVQEMSIRLLTPADAVLLMKWLSDPVVLEYYEGRDRSHDMELVQEHFYKDSDDSVTQCIIQYESKAIGYIQFYLIEDEEIQEYQYEDFKGEIYGMDQFIGEPEFWNQGIGTLLIKEMVKYLIEQKGAKKIVMDPQAWNTRALKVYEKNGFVKKRLLEKHEWHEGKLMDCWLIEYDVMT